MAREFLTFMEKRANNLVQGIANGKTNFHRRPAPSAKTHAAAVNSV